MLKARTMASPSTRGIGKYMSMALLLPIPRVEGAAMVLAFRIAAVVILFCYRVLRSTIPCNALPPLRIRQAWNPAKDRNRVPVDSAHRDAQVPLHGLRQKVSRRRPPQRYTSTRIAGATSVGQIDRTPILARGRQVPRSSRYPQPHRKYRTRCRRSAARRARFPCSEIPAICRM